MSISQHTIQSTGPVAVVPRDPTPAMVAAGLEKLDESQTFGYQPDGDLEREEVMRGMWLAMFDAAARL